MSAKNYLYNWYNRHLDNTESMVLILFILFISLALYYFGSIMLPLIIAIIIAYLLELPISYLVNFKIPRILSVSVVFLVFIGCAVLVIVGVVPILKQQLISLINSLPDMFKEGKKLLGALKSEYPSFMTQGQISDVIDNIKNIGTLLGKYLLSFSIASIGNIITVVVYLILVPILVFFLLKDKYKFLGQAAAFMPAESSLIYKVWQDVNLDLGNYIRGKCLESFIVTIMTYIALVYYDLQYAALLSVLVGVSIFFPYIGAIIVTVPVALVALFQFGLSSVFIKLMIAYTILQLIDGYILVPWLLSEAINMHPIIIILSIIFFGGLFGFWGIFFAIPLAILIRVIISNWPGNQLA